MPRDRPRERLPSGVPGLDDVLCGGLWQGTVDVVQGSPGSGKTVLANQICFAHARRGGHVVYFTLLGESHDQLLTNLRQMSFYDEAQVSNAIHYISAFATVQAQGLNGLTQLMMREREYRGASLVVLDGMFMLEEAAGSQPDLRRVLNELGTLASITRTTILLLTSSRGAEHPEYTMVDAWLELGQEQLGYRTFRFLRVHKSRGSNALAGQHHAEITDAGVRIFPRLESLRPGAGVPAGRRRISTGIEELDRMLQGGIDSAAMGIVAGPSGVGKTSFGLHFVGASRPEEPGLVFGFYEDETDLLEKGTALGLELQDLVDRGALEIIWCPPLEGRIDAMAYKLLEAARRRRVSRLLVDGMEAFGQSAL
ncbi:MAG TPA: ATPase domain-containing protein, partial [Pseudomonadales bacterium]